MVFYFYFGGMRTTPTFEFSRQFAPAISSNAKEIFKELDSKRKEVLLLLSKQATSADTLEKAVTDYLSLLRGLVDGVEAPEGKDLGQQRARIRQSGIVFRWDNIIGPPFSDSHDPSYELHSMALNFALWHIKAASKTSETVDVEREAATVSVLFRSLKLASGILSAVAKHDVADTQGDLHHELVQAASILALAQAEEVTIQMGIVRRSPVDYLAGVAHDIAEKYNEASRLVSSARQARSQKLFHYLRFKSDAYMAYAYCFHGAALLQKAQAGQAIRCHQIANQYCERAQKAAVDHWDGKKDSKDHVFFVRLRRILKIHSDKADSENSLIHRQKPPTDFIQLDAVQAAVQAESWVLPPVNSRWTYQIYASLKADKLPPLPVQKEKPAGKDEHAKDEKKK